MSRRLLVAALLVAALVMAVSCTACGNGDGGDDGDTTETATSSATPSEVNGGAPGGEDASGLTIVRSDEYGFMFKYDADVLTELRGVEAGGSVGGDSVLRLGFFDTDGTEVGGQYRDGFLLNVYRLSRVLDETSMPAFREELESVFLPQMAQSQGPGTQIGELQSVEGPNVQGFYADAVYLIEDVPFKARLFFLVNGDVEYQLSFQAEDDAWADLQPAFRQVIDTLVIQPVAPAASMGPEESATPAE